MQPSKRQVAGRVMNDDRMTRFLEQQAEEIRVILKEQNDDADELLHDLIIEHGGPGLENPDDFLDIVEGISILIDERIAALVKRIMKTGDWAR